MPDDLATDFIFEAYRDLLTCRNDAGSIPWTAARLYAEDHELDAEARSLFWLIIRAMDEADREWQASNPPEG